MPSATRPPLRAGSILGDESPTAAIGSPAGARPDATSATKTIFAEVEAPFAFVDLDAMWANADDMLRRAAGKPIRVASKSVRCRALLERILDRDERFRGLLTFTLPETLWLAEQGYEDMLLAYPTADTRRARGAGHALAPPTRTGRRS